MGLYDSFWSPYNEECPNCGKDIHSKWEGVRTEYQTKAMSNSMDSWMVGDKLDEFQRNGIDLQWARVPCYNFCNGCNKAILKFALIRENTFVGFSSEIYVETWDENQKKYLKDRIK